MIYVIPQIMPLLAQMTTKLSFATRSLIWVSDFLRHNFIFLVIVLIALGLMFRGYILTEP